MVKSQSPYRFVPLPRTMVEGPLRFDQIHHGCPLKEGQSGTIELTLEAATPFCIGAEGKGGVYHPIQVGGEYVIPGASLKGMFRSVLEMATYSHLNRINHGNHYGIRDFNNSRYRQKVSPNDIQAGWLTYDAVDNKWFLKPAAPFRDKKNPKLSYSFLKVDVLLLANATPGSTNASADDYRRKEWVDLKLEAKRHALAKNGFKDDECVISFDRDKVTALGYRGSGLKAYLVCSGAGSYDPSEPEGQRGKYKEVMIGKPAAQDKWVELDHDTVLNFAKINSIPTQDGLKPDGNWEYWLTRMGYPEPSSGRPLGPRIEGDKYPGIPVFYCGDPRHPQKDGQDAFFMGLSRVIKVPYDYSLSQIAARSLEIGSDTHYEIPGLDEALDFARAIFGDVEGAMTNAGEKPEGEKDRKALKSRVSFGFCFADQGTARLEPETFEASMMGPRASYWPFYLVNRDKPECPASYDDEKAVLAGRKRYPAFKEVVSLHGVDKGTDKTRSSIRFLQAGATFSGQVRYHNLHPVELGALLWCLKMGMKDEKRYFHGLGRGKAFGYGCVRCDYEVKGVEPATVDGFINHFVDYMNAKVAGANEVDPLTKPWLNSPTIKALQALALPKDRRQYRYMKLENADKKNDFVELKGAIKDARARYPLLPVDED